MQTIAGILSAHEDRHWTNARAGITALDTQRGYEGIIAYPDDPDPVSALNQAVTQLKQAYADSITAANARTHSVTENYPVCDMRSWMTPPKIKWALAGGLALVLSGASPLRAQSSVTARCDSAAKVIAKGHPAATDNWAFVELRNCGRAGAQAFAEGLGHYASERDIDVLRRYMDRVDDWHDASIFDAALTMATNASATPQARVYAIRHLIVLLVPHRYFLYDELAKGLDTVRTRDGSIRFNLACQSIVTAERSGTLSGEPLPAGYEARIRETLTSIAESPSSPTPVRNAARCVSLAR